MHAGTLRREARPARSPTSICYSTAQRRLVVHSECAGGGPLVAAGGAAGGAALVGAGGGVGRRLDRRGTESPPKPTGDRADGDAACLAAGQVEARLGAGAGRRIFTAAAGYITDVAAGSLRLRLRLNIRAGQRRRRRSRLTTNSCDEGGGPCMVESGGRCSGGPQLAARLTDKTGYTTPCSVGGRFVFQIETQVTKSKL